MLKHKIAILPCTGVGQVVGTIARQAAYRVCDKKRPDETALVCLPALVKGVQEDIDMIRECPVIVIEGCKECCATYALELQQGRASRSVRVWDVLKGKGLVIKREARSRLTASEETAVTLVAEDVVKQLDSIMQEEGNAEDE